MHTILVIRTTKLECWSRKFAGIQDFARRRDWRLQVIDGSDGPLRIGDLLAFWKPEGCIVESDGAAANFTPRDFGRLPTVFLDHSPALVRQGSSVVRHDSALIAQWAAKELLKLNLKAYAVVGWPHNLYWVKDKVESFRKTLALNGYSASVFKPSPGAQRDTTAIRRQLQAWIGKLPRPCGVFGVNDRVCEIVLSAVTSAGISVPEEVAFVGADNDALICETTVPSLTSIQPDFYQSGFRTAELLDRHMQDPSFPACLAVIPPLRTVHRLSSRLFQRTDPLVKEILMRIERETACGLTARQALTGLPCSRRQAELRFRAATGRSVLKEIQDVRFSLAMNLIRNPLVALGAIADRSGWPSTLVLSRYALRRTGKTLTQLRKDALGATPPGGRL